MIVGKTDAARDGASCRPPSRGGSGRPATRGRSTARPAARAAARRRRWPPGWCRSPTATTAAARSGSRPPAAAWSGSRPRADGCRSARTAGRASSSIDGVLTRTVRRDRRGCSTCWPATSPATRTGRRRPERAVRAAAAREPGRLRVGLALNVAARGRGRSTRSASGRARRRARCSSRSATTSRRSRRRGRASTCCRTSPARSARWSSMTVLVGGRLAGREPTEDDVEPLTWALWERARSAEHDQLPRRRGPARVGRAHDRRLPRALRRRAHAGARRAARCRSARSTVAAPTRGTTTSARATSRRTRRSSTSPGCPAISLPLYHGDDGLPTGVQLIGRPAREDALLALAAQLEQALPWAARRPTLRQRSR